MKTPIPKFNTIPLQNVMAIAVAIATGAGFVFFPAISDDLGYMLPFKEYLEGGTIDFWETIRSSIVQRYLHDNARLSNIIMILIAWWPRWIPALVSAFAVWATLWLGGKIGNFRHNSGIFALWCGLFTVFFPWIDQMYVLVFQINYLWPMPLCLLLLHRWLSKDSPGIPDFMLALLVGFWHNAFAASMICAAIGLLTFYPKYRNLRFVSNALFFLPGMLHIWLAPSSRHVWLWFLGREYVMVPYLLPLLAFLFLIGRRAMREHRVSLSCTTVALAALGVSSCAFMILYPMGARTGAIGATASCIGLCSMLNPSSRVWRGIAASVFIYAIIFVHLGAVGYQSFKAGKSTREAISLYRSNPAVTHFVDFTLREDAPWICLQKPYYGWFAHSSTRWMFSRMYGIDNQPFKIAPETLRNFNVAEADPIPGDAGFMLYNGLIVGPCDNNPTALVMLTCTINGKTARRKFYRCPLIAGNIEPGFAWYYPEDSTIDQLFGSTCTSISTHQR